MNKLLQKLAKIFLGLSMAAGVGVAIGADKSGAGRVDATDTSFVSANQGWSNQQNINDVTKSFTNSAVTVTFKKGSASTNTQYYTSGGVRSYAKSYFVVSCSSGNLTSITLTYTQSNSVSTDVGTYSNKVWSGESASVTFTVGGASGHIRLSQIDATFSSAGTIVNKTITGPSNMNKNVGDTDVNIANDIKVDGAVFSGCTVASSNTDAVTVSGTTLSFIGAGTSTITISHANVVDGTTTYVYANATFSVTVAVVKNPLPSMVSGDYGKITSDSDLADGYYLLVCESSSKAFNGSASTLDSNTGYTVSISNDSIGSTSSTDAEALYIKSNGQTNGYSVVAKVKYADNGYKYIGRTANSNGLDESDTPLANTITFDNDGHVLIDGAGGRRLCMYNGATYRYYATGNTKNLYLYKKGTSAATFNVTYDKNGEDVSGDVPTDATNYSTGATVTVLGNTGSLTKSEFTWNGWNTSPDGSGTHYVAGGTFSISGNVTLYAEWVKSLDAISSISGSVSSTLSKAGTYDWDFSNISVTGTLSGVTGQDIKNYVDLTSSTVVPSTIGSCTVSVTATKKTTTPGSATSLTNSSISGEVEAAKLVYSFTITQADLLQTGISYANENAHDKSSTATCVEHDDIEIAWASNQIMKNNSDIQFQTTNGYLYNTTEIPGTITDVSVTATAQSFTVYYGNSEHPTSGTTPGGKYFTVQGVGSTPKASSITITFEVSDKPKVQLVAADINLDVADGAASANVTDGSSTVTGYHLASEDSYVASITNDGKVQPVGYGKTKVVVTKDEDAGHIYLATTFVVTVGDHSKEVSVMQFTEKAGGSATADDGVEWTITTSATENDFSEVYGINYGTNQNKVNSLVFTTPADGERIIKNVVIEAMSAIDGSTITVSVGGTSFTCSRTNDLTGNVLTFNFSGHTSGAITITMSGTASSKYGVKSIAVLYVGDEATSFASTFLGAISCNSSGTSKPTFNLQEDGQTSWTWTLLASEYNELSQSDKDKFAVNATGVNATIAECVARYDYIVGKYYVGGLDTTLISSDFMGRNPSAVGTSGSALLFATNMKTTKTVATIVIISMVSVTAIGGYFFLRKRKENN